MILGCIADDFTGATDLANTLARGGMRVIQTIGIPEQPPADADAVVVALKSRTIAAADAVDQSLAACRWLKAHGARQIFFKYCSTFDSTAKGNIGPVADALLEELKCDVATVCPAFPDNGRTIYLGHLSVGDVLLSDSGMRDHPLTPMRDANLMRVMASQSRHRVGNVPVNSVRKGSGAMRQAMAELHAKGMRYVVVDAIANDDLLVLGEAVADHALVTGGSGAALGLPENFRRQGLLRSSQGVDSLPKIGGPAIVISGSCSTATNAQVAAFKTRHPALALDMTLLFDDDESAVGNAVNWALQNSTKEPALIYATAAPDAVKALQEAHGRERTGEVIERALGDVASRLAAAGVRRFVVAGGETSGAVTKALNVKSLRIGKQIAPGVPATLSCEAPNYALVLKSGNFGGPDFFAEAVGAIP